MHTPAIIVYPHDVQGTAVIDSDPRLAPVTKAQVEAVLTGEIASHSHAGGGSYTHPATHSADMIVDGTTNKAYTATEQAKLAGIEPGAEVNEVSALDLINGLAGKVDTNDARLSDARTPTAHSHAEGDVTGLTAALAGKAAASHTHPYEPADVAIQAHIAAPHAPANATANSSDAALLSRANHTGTQLAATISDFSSAADARIGAASVNALADVTVATPVTGQVLKWNGTAWVNDTVAGGGAAWGGISGTLSNQTDLQTALNGKSASGHNHTGVYEPANANIQSHVLQAHAPANAQKNSDITKAEIETKLTGVISSHSHAGGGGTTKISGDTGAFVADATWETLTANSADITVTTQTTVMTITGVTPGIYRFKGLLVYQTAATTTGIGITANHTGTVSRFVTNWYQITTGGSASTGVADQVTTVAGGQLVEGKAERAKDTRSSFTVGVDTANADELAQFEGIFVVTVTGNFEIKIATEVAASAVRLMAGSTVELNKVA